MPPKVDTDYAECRSLGHSWRHRGTYGTDDTPADPRHTRPFGMTYGCVGYYSQCLMCATDRVKWITRSGEVITRYFYPQGYSQHGEDRLSPMQWRRSFVAHIFEEFTSHDQQQQTA